MIEDLRDLQKALSDFEKNLAKLTTTTVTRQGLIVVARQLVDRYFRNVRGSLTASDSLAGGALAELDDGMHQLLESTHRRTNTTIYRKVVRQLRAGTLDAEKRLLAATGASRAAPAGDPVDRRIIATLQGLLPSAALAYEQALLDLASPSRLSWRGPATDFREALRETLDHLAPDADVSGQPGFKPEPNTSGPTMKQRVRYILRQRGKSKPSIDASEAAVEAVENAVGAFVRSVYARSSVSTHTPTNRDEVTRIRDFVRVALCELLEVRD